MTEVKKNDGLFYLLFKYLLEEIPFVVLRNYDALPNKPLPLSDVDLLIRKKDRKKYLLVLKKVAAKTESFILAKFDQSNCLSCFVYQKNTLNGGVWLDAFTELSSKGFVWADSHSLIERRFFRPEKGFFTLTKGAEAATLFIKEIFSHSFIKERYLSRIPDLVRSDKQNFRETLKPFFSEKTIQGMIDICLNGEWTKAIKRRKIWFFGLVLTSFLKKPFDQTYALLNFSWSHFKKAISLKGLTVIFMGPDGVGKTTAGQKLKEDLKNLPYKKIYEYHGHIGFFPEWRKVYQLIFKKEKKRQEDFPRQEKKVGVLRATLSLLYYGIEHFLAWPWILWLKIRGNLVIFDRYFYDFATLNVSSKLPLKLFWFLTKFIHRPDLTFIMQAAPETIYSRKKELVLGEIKRQSGLFKDARILDLTSAICIASEESPEAVSTRVKEEIFKNLSKRYNN